MVTFTCNACGSALKKNKVDKHLYQCRTSSLSCIDCFKDFDLNSYNNHNQCISEDQKYGGAEFKPKPGANKGQAKQQEWIQKIRALAEAGDVKKSVKELIDHLLKFENIPRKKQKFVNFIINSGCRKYANSDTIEEVWKLFELANKKDDSGSDSQENKNGAVDKHIGENKPGKRKLEVGEESERGKEEGEENCRNGEEVREEVTTKKLKLAKVIKRCLKQAEDQQMRMKKLRKEVLKVYKSSGQEYDKNEIKQRFNEKIDSQKFAVVDGVVKLNQGQAGSE